MTFLNIFKFSDKQHKILLQISYRALKTYFLAFYFSGLV